MAYNKYKQIIFSLVLVVGITEVSCKKFLETKSDQRLSRPETLEDLQAILDNPGLNKGMNLTNVGTDEYYVEYNHWANRRELPKKGYIWDPQVNDLQDWQVQYNTVFYANTVLYNLPLLAEPGSSERMKSIQGTALFYRAFSFFNLAQLYAPQYDVTTASSDLGIPLRLEADFNEQSTRASIQQTYDRIIEDLLSALPLLPNTSTTSVRPVKASCYAMLARTYLQMGDYTKAKENATACLQLRSTLLDFNTLTPSADYPFPEFRNNPEILFYSITDVPLNADNSRAKIDSSLYDSFTADDLRKQVYFRNNGNGTFAFKGNYSGGFDLFNGLATDEIYLIRAECFARDGKIAEAMDDLNTLLETRWINGTFKSIIASTTQTALQLILAERKKELIYRAIRWPDLKRLNKDPNFAITIKRMLEGQTYELSPNDLRYSLLVPVEVLSLVQLQQNPR